MTLDPQVGEIAHAQRKYLLTWPRTETDTACCTPAASHSARLTLSEGLVGVQVKSFEVELAGLVSVATCHLQLGPGMPAGH